MSSYWAVCNILQPRVGGWKMPSCQLVCLLPGPHMQYLLCRGTVRPRLKACRSFTRSTISPVKCWLRSECIDLQSHVNGCDCRMQQMHVLQQACVQSTVCSCIVVFRCALCSLLFSWDPHKQLVASRKAPLLQLRRTIYLRMLCGPRLHVALHERNYIGDRLHTRQCLLRCWKYHSRDEQD